MSPTLYRNEWASSHEDWDESTEAHEQEGFRPTNTDNEGAFVRKVALADGLISQINRRYDFRGGLALEEFLQKSLRDNPHLSGLLFEAHEMIRDPRYFGSGARLALEVVTDPEALGDRQLFVVIRTKFPRKIARAILSTLDQEWWLDALPATEGKVEIALG